MLVGRHPSADIRFDDPLVSRMHARLRVADQDVVVEDLGSTGGTRVNGAPLEGPRRLHPGDVISFATVDAEYQHPAGQPDDKTGSVPSAMPPPGPRETPAKDRRKLPVIAALGLVVAAISAAAAAYPVFFRHAPSTATADYQSAVATFCRDTGNLLSPIAYYTPSGGLDKDGYIAALQRVPATVHAQFQALGPAPQSLRSQYQAAADQEHKYEQAVTTYAYELGSIPADQLTVQQLVPGPVSVWQPLETTAADFLTTLDRLSGGRCTAKS
jgi:hypothetical protein